MKKHARVHVQHHAGVTQEHLQIHSEHIVDTELKWHVCKLTNQTLAKCTHLGGILGGKQPSYLLEHCTDLNIQQHRLLLHQPLHPHALWQRFPAAR